MKSIFLGSAILATTTLGFKMENEQSTAIAVADPTECIKEHCPDQYDHCQKDPKCLPALEDCEKKCGTKTSCWQFCLPSKGSQAAIDVAKCAAANHCLSSAVEVEAPVIVQTSTAVAVADPTECIKEHCPDQYDHCQKDPKCLPAIQDCEKKCGTKTSCWQLCLPSKGSQAAIDVAKCAAANHCMSSVEAPVEVEEVSTAVAVIVGDPTECIKEHCPSQYEHCQKDSKCLPALQDCEKKCGTKTSCWQFCLPSKGSQAAIDVAKCAASNHCLSEPAETHPFELCMSKDCKHPFSHCMADSECRAALRLCRNPEKVWEFSMECLSIKSSFNERLRDFFTCAGETKCI